MTDTNPFGGGNPQSLYVPLSEVEQEVISRLVAAGDLEVRVLGWGVVNKPKVIFGDARMSITLPLYFNAPEPPGIPLYYLDLELRTGSGILLFRDRKSVVYGDKPVWAAAGVELLFVWDIMIAAIDPEIVKALKPGAIGYTSRLQDRDTKEMTLEGNMRLDTRERFLLRTLRGGEAAARADNAQQAAKAVKKEGER